jgi:hypothetical protein
MVGLLKKEIILHLLFTSLLIDNILLLYQPDEIHALNALQTLADLSLMMPTSKGEFGKNKVVDIFYSVSEIGLSLTHPYREKQ